MEAANPARSPTTPPPKMCIRDRPKSDADSDWWNMVYRWTDCPVLTGMELGSYTSDAVQSLSLIHI